MSGFIITGGMPVAQAGDLVEVYNPQTEKTCWLYDLPDKRQYHSYCGNLICGGSDGYEEDSRFKNYKTARTCLFFDSRVGGFYNTLVRLAQKREAHLCWELNGEGGDFLLLGGWHSPASTELVNHQGRSSSTSFRLKYDTM